MVTMVNTKKRLLVSTSVVICLIGSGGFAGIAQADDGTYAPSGGPNNVAAPSFYHHTPKPAGGATIDGAMDDDMQEPGVNDTDAYSPGELGGSQGTGYIKSFWWAKPQTPHSAEGTPGDD